jgi:cytochrome c-type biogenesis protein CcmH/NrfG
MYNFGSQYCPRCQSEIANENILGATAICSQCGWNPDKNEVIYHNETQKKIVQIFVVISILMIIVYFFTVKWDHYSLSVVGYKIQGLFGGQSTQTLSAMSDICKDRKLYTCSVEQLQNLTRVQPQNLEAVAQLATLLHRTNRENEALQAYSNYFSNNGDSKDLAFQFAKLLEKQGHLEKAMEFY